MMAFLQMNYHSDVLKTGVTVNVILPERAKTLIGMDTKGDGTYKTLFLFHGLSDDHSCWMRRTSIERYAAEYGIAVVMPDVGRSWYADTAYGAKYFTFVTRELPEVCRGFFKGMSTRREDTLVGGLSMGGYGAVKAALRCPETFGGCISLSGAFDIMGMCRTKIQEEWKGIFGFDMEDPAQLAGSIHDVYALAQQNNRTGTPFPKLYLWCGESDFLLDANRQFHTLLDRLGVAHRYEESEGNHAWKWWDLHIRDGLKYLLQK